MRKVSFINYENGGFAKYEGLFHQWATTSCDLNNSIVTETKAIIELPDGTIKMPYPMHVTFLPAEPVGKEMD